MLEWRTRRKRRKTNTHIKTTWKPTKNSLEQFKCIGCLIFILYVGFISVCDSGHGHSNSMWLITDWFRSVSKTESEFEFVLVSGSMMKGEVGTAWAFRVALKSLCLLLANSCLIQWTNSNKAQRWNRTITLAGISRIFNLDGLLD